LCKSGVLPFQRVGSHRRIRQSDVARFLDRQPEPSREDYRNLWLHRAIAFELLVDPDRVLSIARRNVEIQLEKHPVGLMNEWARQWRVLVSGDLEELLASMTSMNEISRELRANSVFIGVLDPTTRTRVLSSFARYWRGKRAD
jgi:hypothetical protein